MRRLDISILPLSAWPATDQAAWTAALSDGGLFGDQGALVRYSEDRRKVMQSAYGRWLGFLAVGTEAPLATGLDEAGVAIRVAAFMTRLDAVAPCTARGYMTDLLTVCRALRPGEPFKLVHRGVRHLWRTAKSVTDKHAKMVPARDLYQFGLELMRDAPKRSTLLKRAGCYRDGLMIAMLMAAPVRLGNFVSINIDEHLVWDGSCYRLCFRRGEVKTKRTLEYALKPELTPYIREWLDIYRPECASRRGRYYAGDAGSAFWVSDHGSAFRSQSSVRERIERQTLRRFGRCINPHLFRDIAATSIASQIPEDVGITREVLGHTNMATGQRHYNQARSVIAASKLQDALSQFRQAGTTASNEAL